MVGAVQAAGAIPLEVRIDTFIGCCPLRLIWEDGSQALLGRGSSPLIKRFDLTRGKKNHAPAIEVGNFCEAARSVIQIGGEHANDSIFNNSLSGLPLLRSYLKNNGLDGYQATHPQTTHIGHGVILSKNCLINAGARIGNGAVIGAGAVVTRSPVPAWAVAVGVPARRIKDRISPAQQEIAEALQWWNWDIEFFCRHAHLLFDVEKNYKTLLAGKVMADDRYRLVVGGTRGRY